MTTKNERRTRVDEKAGSVALAKCDTLPCYEDIIYPIRRLKRTIHFRAIRAGMRHESAWAGLGRARWEACEEKGGGGHRSQARRGNAEFAEKWRELRETP